MSNKNKFIGERLLNIQVGFPPSLIGNVDCTALENNMSRNEVIRTACLYLLKNKKKFKLK